MVHPAPPPAIDFQALFDATPSPYLVLSNELFIVSVNQAYLQATKTTRDDLIGRHMFDAFPDNPDDPSASGVANLRASLLRALHGKRADTMAIQKYDILVPGPGGMVFEERFWSPVNTPVLDDAGEVTHIIHRVEDVTDYVRAKANTARMASRIDDQEIEIEIANRRLREANDTLEERVAARTEAQHLTEEKLRASELRFRLMADSVPQIIWIVDSDGRGVYFNKQWSLYTGVALDSIRPEDVSDNFVHPDDHAATMAAWSHAQASGQTYSVEHRIRSALGEYRWFLVRAEPYLDPASGQIAMWFGTSTDVHDRKLAEAALSEREEMLRLAIDAADVGEWYVDMLDHSIFWPPRVRAMFGIFDERPVTLADFYTGLHPDDRERTGVSFAQAADPLHRTQYESEYRTVGRDDGVIRWVAAKGRGIFDASGRCIRMIGTAIDITKRKADEEALRESGERLRQADRRKDEFLAMLAHELRNPLAPISTAAQVMRLRYGDAEYVKRASDIIGRQVRHMTDLVDDLLDVSRVTRGQVQMEREPVDLKTVVNNAVEQARPLIEARHHDLFMHLAADTAWVSGDRTRLTQAVSNLLNNAAKYTQQHGRIELDLRILDGWATLAVRDNGSGIAPGLLPHVFELFTQGERTPDRAQGGLGLGLALVQSIAAHHGGTVEAESGGAGQGSCFTLRLPTIEAPALHAAGDGQARDAEQPQPSTPRRIVIVDDNRDAGASLAAALEARGHGIALFDGAQALLDARDLGPVDAYILDIGLPGIDGYQLARRLRQDGPCPEALLIALTGYGQAHDFTLSKAAGFDHHLVKPADLGQLERILHEGADRIVR